MKLNNFAKITKKALKLNKVVYFLIVFIVLFGTYSFESMTKSLMPQFELPFITVVTTMVGASAEDIEEMVTEEIEDELTDIPNVEEVISRSSKNVSSILLKFKADSDKNIALQNVERKINKIKKNLPDDASSPVVSNVDPNNFPSILVNIPANQPYDKLDNTINNLKIILNRIDGIKSVDTFGLKKPQINIYPDFKELEKYNISNSMLINILKDKNINIPLGEKEVNDMVYSFETDNKIKSLNELKNIIIISYQGRIIKLQDIADVKYEDKDSDLKNYMVKDKKRTAVVNLALFLKDNADSIKVNDECIRQVEIWNKKHPNEEISLSLDTSIYIKTSIKDISTNAFSGILSVIIVLFLFINLRESIVASLVIPITLISSIILFKPFGLTINILSIFGLIVALGMLVDNAIVVIEMIDENKIKLANSNFKDVILFSTNKVGPAIFSSTLTTICAFIPLAFLSGPIGSLIRSIPIAMAISVSLSFIVSITLTPVLAYSFLHNFDDNKNNSFMIKIIQIIIVIICALYAFSDSFKLTKLSFIFAIVVAILAWLKLFKKPGKYSFKDMFNITITSIIESKLLQILVTILTIIIFIYSMSLLASDKIPKQNFPDSDEPMMLAKISILEGSSDKDIKNTFEKIQNILESKNYIKLHTAVVNGNNQQYFIELKEDRQIHNKDIIEELSNELNNIPNVKAKVNPNNVEAFPILIRLSGDNYNDIIAESKKVVKIIDNITGVINPRADYEYGNPTAKINIDKLKASQNDIPVSQLSMELRHIIAGKELTDIKMDDRSIKTYIKYDDYIKNVHDIKNIKVMNTKNKLIPIYDLIEIEEYRSLKTLTHINGKKIVEVKALNDKNTTVPKIIKEFRKELEKQGGMKKGVNYTIGGEFDQMKKSYVDLFVKFIVALVLVYVVLLVQFNSFIQPLIIILCIPFSMIGVSIGYFFFGITFSTLSFLGIISLVGIAINDAIVLMDFINQLRKEGLSKKESIIEGANSRLKPIITTSLTTIIGVLPLSIYSPNYSQMAYALIFGLIGSTILTLIVIPTILNIIEGIGAIFRRKEYQIEK